MGFGILFFGYFLFLNLTRPSYTDLLGALICLLAFYKLANVNKYFRMSIVPTAIFGVFGLFELACELASPFGFDLGDAAMYIASPRYVLLLALSVTMLLGIYDVAREVGALSTVRHSKISRLLSIILFPICAIIDFPLTMQLFTSKYAMAVFSAAAIISLFVAMILNVVTIYSAYMHICMPENKNNDAPRKPSRFGIVNKFREHEEEKAREYAEYKRKKREKRENRRKKK